MTFCKDMDKTPTDLEMKKYLRLLPASWIDAALRIADRFSRQLVRLRVDPNALTVLGLLSGAAVGLFYGLDLAGLAAAFTGLRLTALGLVVLALDFGLALVVFLLAIAGFSSVVESGRVPTWSLLRLCLRAQKTASDELHAPAGLSITSLTFIEGPCALYHFGRLGFGAIVVHGPVDLLPGHL